MEVHHHPNTEKKNFKEYFLEFIMIFLAVTMGFIAENIREHFANNETEQRNMEIIVDNLKDDTAQLQLIIFKNENKVRTLGTLLSFQDTDNPDTLRSDFFNAVFLRSFSTWYFFSNNAAIEQMKSSESLRLVKNKTVLDGIFNYGYENNIIAINHAYADMWVNRGTENGSRFLKFRNVFPSLKSIALAQNNVIGNMPRKYHVEGMLEFFNDAAAHRAVLSSFYVRDLRNQQKNAAALISLLQKEYHLEDE